MFTVSVRRKSIISPKVSKLPLRTVAPSSCALRGLGSLPGGGGEILVDRVRSYAMTRGKVMTDDWLNVHRVCGIRWGATSTARDDV